MCTVPCGQVQTLAAQIKAAMVLRGWSVPKLLKESGLKCTRPSLQRKLAGKQKLSTAEAERLACVLDVSFSVEIGAVA